MSNFTTVNLTGERVLVTGTDRFGTDGKVVLDASQWLEVQRHSQFHSASESFDEAVERFFEPLMEAASKLEDALSTPKPDPDTYIVLSEGVEGTPGRSQEVIKLDPDSVVLRLLERGDTDRLVWVMDQLEVMAVEELPATDLGEQPTPTGFFTPDEPVEGQDYHIEPQSDQG